MKDSLVIVIGPGENVAGIELARVIADKTSNHVVVVEGHKFAHSQSIPIRYVPIIPIIKSKVIVKSGRDKRRERRMNQRIKK